MGGLGPGIGGSEWFIIGLVALLVVGPERLPGLLRQLGKLVARARGMANEFRSSFDEMARQSELDDLRKEVEALRTGQGPARLGAEANEAFKDIKSEFDKPLFDAPAMTPAPSEWPDGEPVMMPVASPPVVAEEVLASTETAVAAKPKAPRKTTTAKAASAAASAAVAVAKPGAKPAAKRTPKATPKASTAKAPAARAPRKTKTKTDT